MKKNFRKSLAAVACAAVMAAQMGTAAAAAVDTSVGYYYYYNGYYYTTAAAATVAAGNSGSWVKVDAHNVPTNATEMYYDSLTNKYYSSKDAAIAAGSVNYEKIYHISASSTPSSVYTYYSTVTGKYYTTYSAALNASGGVAAYVQTITLSSVYGSYYSTVTGKYYSSYSAALSASGNVAAYVIYVGGAVNTSGYYYSYTTNSYFKTYNEALLASGGLSDKVTFVEQNNNLTFYYSSVTGRYYGSYAVALNASNNDKSAITYLGNTFTGTTSTGVTAYRYYYNGKYYNTLSDAIAAGGIYGVTISVVPYYSNYYGYYSDNYLYYLNSFFNNNSSTTASEGTPYVYGKKGKAGWTNVMKYIKSLTSGESLKVVMNGETIIEKEVLDVFDGKNVTVTFVLDNGVEWTINGKDIDELKDINIYTEYNLDYIPDTLVKKATKGAIAKAEIGISTTFADFDTEASVTVKFNKKRAGCTAVVYRYDNKKNSLKCVDKVYVQDDGKCTFDVDAGGPYLIVLK